MRRFHVKEEPGQQRSSITIALGAWDWVHKFNKVFDVDPPVTDGLFVVGLPDVPPEMRQHLVDVGLGK